MKEKIVVIKQQPIISQDVIHLSENKNNYLSANHFNNQAGTNHALCLKNETDIVSESFPLLSGDFFLRPA